MHINGQAGHEKRAIKGLHNHRQNFYNYALHSWTDERPESRQYNWGSQDVRADKNQEMFIKSRRDQFRKLGRENDFYTWSKKRDDSGKKHPVVIERKTQLEPKESL